MKVFHDNGCREFTPKEFLDYLLSERIYVKSGVITDAEILERKRLSNKGNAVSGRINLLDGFSIGLNVGGNPIGAGYRNYLPFLKEMGCSKFLGLYLPDSLVGKTILLLMRGEHTIGYMSPESFSQLETGEAKQQMEEIAQFTKMIKDILHSSTNESLEAVVQGLNLKPSDMVLSVAGCGDQAFAMLEYDCRVKIVDDIEKQTDFVKRRIEALKEGQFGLFLLDNPRTVHAARTSLERNAYFSKEGRLEKIRSNLANLTVLETSDLFETAEQEAFSKIYLSNSLSYALRPDDATSKIKAITKRLPLDGLLYISDSKVVVMNNEGEFVRLENFELPDLRIDSALTEKARTHEKPRSDWNWTPTVYRKVEVQV